MPLEFEINAHSQALNGLVVSAIMFGVIIVFVIAAIVIYLLRRPLFGLKKKPEQLELEPEVIVSGPPALDQFAVAMNTGIFLPAQGYDLQGCNFQEIPIVGTTVFKPTSRSTSPAPSPAHTARKVTTASNLKDPSLAHMRSGTATSSPLNSRRSSNMSTSTMLSARTHEIPPTPPRSPGPPNYDALEPPAYEDATGPSMAN